MNVSTREKIQSFADLPAGWHYREGVPAKELALKLALILLGDLERAGFADNDAYPGIDGSVMISAYDLPDSYDFDVRPSGRITVAHAREGEDDDIFYQEGMTLEESQQKIKEFRLSQHHAG